MVRKIVADYVNTTKQFSTNARRFLGATLLAWVGLAVSQVVFNLYLVAGGYAEDFVGGVSSMQGIGMAVLALPAGWAADRFGRRAVLRSGVFTLALALGLRALSLVPAALFSATFLLGAGQAMITIAASPFMSENSEEYERTHLFSMHFVVVLLGSICGNLLGGELPGLLERHAPTLASSPLLGFRYTLIAGALVSMFALLPLASVHESHTRAAEQGPPVRARDHAGLLAKLALSFALLGLGAGLIMPFFNLYFSRRYGASASQIGVYFSVAQVITLLATLAGPLVARRLGKLRAITLLQSASLPFLVTLGFETNLQVSVLAFWGRSAFMQMSSPLVNSYAMDSLAPTLRARAHGLNNMVWYIGWSASSALAGLVIARLGWAYPYYLTAVCYGLATIAFWINFRKQAPDTSRIRAQLIEE
jgi:MFS family permease